MFHIRKQKTPKSLPWVNLKWLPLYKIHNHSLNMSTKTKPIYINTWISLPKLILEEPLAKYENPPQKIRALILNKMGCRSLRGSYGAFPVKLVGRWWLRWWSDAPVGEWGSVREEYCVFETKWKRKNRTKWEEVS